MRTQKVPMLFINPKLSSLTSYDYFLGYKLRNDSENEAPTEHTYRRLSPA